MENNPKHPDWPCNVLSQAFVIVMLKPSVTWIFVATEGEEVTQSNVVFVISVVGQSCTEIRGVKCLWRCTLLIFIEGN